jgi:hypothetical protein
MGKIDSLDYINNNYNYFIENEIKLTNWTLLSSYILFFPNEKRKFIIKYELLSKLRRKWPIVNNSNASNSKAYLTAYKNFKKLYNKDIYPHCYREISDIEILFYLKKCHKHKFLPNILSETNNFLEIEYLDDSVWRQSNLIERTTNEYFNAVDNYCSHIKNFKLCVNISDSTDSNIMVNRKTKEFINIDIEDIVALDHFVPIVYNRAKDNNIINYKIRTDYMWSSEIFNKSSSYYIDILKIKETEKSCLKLFNILN